MPTMPAPQTATPATQQVAAFRPVCIDGKRDAISNPPKEDSSPQPLRRALIVEDDPDVAKLLCETLSRAGFQTVEQHDGLSAITAARLHDPELITMDLSIEGMDGFETIRQLRAFSDAHIIIVSSLVDEPDIVQGFATGADDFIHKPFRIREFRAHLDAYLRRAGGSAAEREGADTAQGDRTESNAEAKASGENGTGPRFGAHAADNPAAGTAESKEYANAWILRAGLTVNTISREVYADDTPIKLTKSEFELLVAMLKSGRRVRSKASLALEMRTGQKFLASHIVTDADRRAVEVHMANLRKKLGDHPKHPRWIATVRGIGYQLVPIVDPDNE